MALEPVAKFHDALKAAGHKPEVHIFSAGGHGSDHWIDEFYYWLDAQGFTKTARGSGRR